MRHDVIRDVHRSEGPLSDVFSPWARWEGGLVGIESSSGCGGGGTVGGVARSQAVGTPNGGPRAWMSVFGKIKSQCPH